MENTTRGHVKGALKPGQEAGFTIESTIWYNASESRSGGDRPKCESMGLQANALADKLDLMLGSRSASHVSCAQYNRTT